MDKSTLRGFDFEDFLKTDEHNKNVSIEFLKSKGYWKYFKVVSDIYGNFHDSFESTILKTHSGMAKNLLFGSCFVNLVKGISSVLAGHITDSHIYGRRTLEAKKIAIYLRENSNDAEEWLKTQESKAAQKFKEKIGSWYKNAGGEFLKSEAPGAKVALNAANIAGPHSNFLLSAFHNKIVKNENSYTAKIVFHELEPNIERQIFLLDRYFWHLNIHYWTVFWWIEKSGLDCTLNPELKKFWDDCRVNFEKTLTEFIAESHKKLPIQKFSS